MKTNTKILKTLLLATGMFISVLVLGQTNYRQSGTTTMTIAGTSTMHDWTMTSTGAVYNATFEINADGTPSALNKVSVVVPAESLKSKEKAMDKNAYNSLKTDKYKDIVFNLTSAKISGKTIDCIGNLTIAGVTKTIEVPVAYELVGGNLVCKGNKKIKMTEYKVEPPTFMFGAIKTGDEITVSFDVTLSPIKL